MSQFQENCQKERWTEGRMEGQTLIHRTLPVMARGPISENVIFTMENLVFVKNTF